MSTRALVEGRMSRMSRWPLVCMAVAVVLAGVPFARADVAPPPGPLSGCSAVAATTLAAALVASGFFLVKAYWRPQK